VCIALLPFQTEATIPGIGGGDSEGGGLSSILGLLGSLRGGGDEEQNDFGGHHEHGGFDGGHKHGHGGGDLSSIIGPLGALAGGGGHDVDLTVPIAALKKLIIKKKILLLPHLLKRSKNPILRKLKLIKLLKLKKLILLKKKLLLLHALKSQGSH
jgi:hypothetical protein